MGLALHVTTTPATWPADAATDVRIRIVLRNDGARPTAVFPGLATIAAVASFAGVGITWSLGLADATGEDVPLQELRRWYGPPGNPPSPSWAKEQAVKLARGDEHATELVATWIPNAALEPRHLAPAALDPEGMDGVAGSSRVPGHVGFVALADRIALARASVLVFGALDLATARAQDDFLRGHVVAFVTRPGIHQLRVTYVQASWMGVGEPLRVEAAPVPIQVA